MNTWLGNSTMLYASDYLFWYEIIIHAKPPYAKAKVTSYFNNATISLYIIVKSPVFYIIETS